MKKIVICEGWDKRCLESARELVDEKLIKAVLLDNGEVKNKAKEIGVNIDGFEIVNIDEKKLLSELSDLLVELRKHKGMTKEQADELVQDENYFGLLYALSGRADGVVGSAICPTANLMKPTLQLMRKGGLVNEVSVIKDGKITFFATDMSMNINPTSEDLANMAMNAATVAKNFGHKPKIGMLSFSTKGSGGDGPEIQKIREAIDAVKKDSNYLIDGEFQVDAAVNKDAAKRKCPDSKIAGECNVLVFPDLNSANIFGHSMLQFSNLEFEFTVISGLKKPVSILGRSTPKEVVKKMIASTAAQVR